MNSSFSYYFTDILRAILGVTEATYHFTENVSLSLKDFPKQNTFHLGCVGYMLEMLQSPTKFLLTG